MKKKIGIATIILITVFVAGATVRMAFDGYKIAVLILCLMGMGGVSLFLGWCFGSFDKTED